MREPRQASKKLNFLRFSKVHLAQPSVLKGVSFEFTDFFNFFLDIPRTAMHNSVMQDPISKDLTAASATPLVLSILDKGDSYGYAIIKCVRELSGGAMEWTEGMLYPVLHRLEEQGAIESYWMGDEGARRRKYYRINNQGKELLSALMGHWRAVDSTLQRSLKEGEEHV